MGKLRCCVKKPHDITGSTFGVPKDETLKLQWEGALGMMLKKSDRVCSHHFKHGDIINTWTSGQGFTKYTIDLKRSKLKKGSIPFLNCSKLQEVPKLDKNVTAPPVLRTTVKIPEPDEDLQIKLNHETLFQSVYTNLRLLSIPNNWFSNVEFLKKEIIISFHKLSVMKQNYLRYVEKEVLITNDSNIILHLNGKIMNPVEIRLTVDEIQNKEDLEKFLQIVNAIKCCPGAVSSAERTDIKETFGSHCIESNGTWWHAKCPTVLKSDDTKNDICLWCKRLVYVIKKKRTRVQSGYNSRINILLNKKKEVQMPKKVVKTKNHQENKKDNITLNPTSVLKEQDEISERKGDLRKMKTNNIIVKEHIKEHNYCIKNSDCKPKKVQLKSDPPKEVQNVEYILVNIPK